MTEDINLHQPVRDEVLHQGIDSSPEVDVTSSVGLGVVEIRLTRQHILDQELGLPWKNAPFISYHFFQHFYEIFFFQKFL